LLEAFEQVGPVQHVDHIAAKKIAFVTFKSPESALKAIGQTFLVNGESLVAEERRKFANQKADKKFDNYRGSGAGFQRNGDKPKNGNFKQGRKDKSAANA
jgi:hypothetical protein